MKIEQDKDGSWSVVSSSGRVIADHLTNSGAWAMMDRLDNEAVRMDETRERVRYAFQGEG